MKQFKFFLSGISFISSVVLISGCASIMASIEFPKPIPLSLEQGQLKRVDGTNTKDQFKNYCSGGKQTKSLTLNFTSVNPKNPSGWPINEAGAYMKKLNQKRQCLYRRIFYLLSKEPNCEWGHQSDYLNKLQGKKVCAPNDGSEKLWILLSNISSDKIQGEFKQGAPVLSGESFLPVLVKSKEGRLALGYFLDSHDNHFSKIKTAFGDSVLSGQVVNWSSLINDFTILEPLEFQKITYTDEIEKASDSELCSLQDEYEGELASIHTGESWESVSAFGIDETGKIDVSATISQRDRIWRRYISRFTKVKESTNPSSPQLINTQLSLDLNAFCRYGRSIGDLASK